MRIHKISVGLAAIAIGFASFADYHKGKGSDWPMWGRTPDRNMIGEAKNLPVNVEPGDYVSGTDDIDPSTTENVLWVAKLGSQAYGNVTVAGGKVFAGTNNESPRDPKQLGDRGVLMAFNEENGEFEWQLLIPKLGAGKVSDWEYVGLCSSPAVEGNKVYVVTNRGEAVCLDLNGLTNGNDGPFQDEANYMSADGNPVELSNGHADILWIYDMREELGVFPHNVSSCSPLVVDDLLYVSTSNGVDWSHNNIPAPFSPALVALNKTTGELVGEEASQVSERVLHASWSSPAYGDINGTPLIIWGGGDGICYGFEPKPVVGSEGYEILNEVFRYDANPPEYRMKEGKSIKYATYPGPSEIISTVVVHDNKAFALIGQDPEHGDGVGMLSAIDASMRGDISGKAIWTYKDIGRTVSTPSIYNGMIFVAEYDGDIHCLDLDTGKVNWVHATDSRIWGSTLVADGKVYLPNEDGQLVVLAATKEKEELATVEFFTPIYSSPVVAKDVLYVATQTHLYALKRGGK
ncbi:MAG TPA: pyrrolo-quinoline quinone [Opitutae bacterium]|nr:pyrrolo-quinoline quinone [Opitutae bacterium]